jgi:putative ABC transport system ATP-binding protein
MSIGYALSGSSPSPAVMLVPANSTTPRALRGVVDEAGPAFAALDCESDVVADDSTPDDRVAGRPSEPFAQAPTYTAHVSAASADTRLRYIQTLPRPRPRPRCSLMLIARDLTKEYRSGDNRLAVLRDVSFSIPQGAFVAIVGPSGSGKTTLLGLLAGLDTPTRGQVLLDDADLTAMDEDERARLRGEKVGFVFQSFQLISTLTALENVQVPLELRGDSGAADRARELLRRVGLGDRLDHFPTQLSGGEQQRVAIARAFANSPRILFADEPTGNLDSDTGGRIVELLEALNRESKTTIILVTHDHALAAHAQRIIRLSDGRVISDVETERAA